MLKPFLHEHGTSEPVRDGLLPVHHLVLHQLPATLRAATSMIIELAKRPSTEDVSLLLTAPAALLDHHGPPAHSSDRTLALATALPPWLVGRRKPTREESPEEVRVRLIIGELL